MRVGITRRRTCGNLTRREGVTDYSGVVSIPPKLNEEMRLLLKAVVCLAAGELTALTLSLRPNRIGMITCAEKR